MVSLHLSGSPWFLLLIPAGAWLFWRQYRSAGAASRMQGRILFALQFLALAILAVSLAAPELRKHEVEFHDPAILILRDQSGSFRNGSYLGLGRAHGDMEAALAAAYRTRKFAVLVADFAQSAWPVAGFRGLGKGASRGEAGAGTGAALTDVGAAADFVDTAGIPNLQAVFLFSDGRSNLDASQAPRTWKAPVYPVVFPVDSIAEVQVERVAFSAAASPRGSGKDAQGISPAGNRTSGMELEVAWRPVGRLAGEPVVRILAGSGSPLDLRMRVDGDGRAAAALAKPVQALSPAEGPLVSRLPFAWDAGKAGARENLRAVVRPAAAAENFDVYNDTLAVAGAAGRAERRIRVLKPVRSLDEKGMLDILYAWEGADVSVLSREDLGRAGLTEKDQVWVEASLLAASGGLAASLAEIPAKVVVYARAAGSGPDLQLGGARIRWQEFSPASEVRVAKGGEEFFPDEVVRLKSLSAASLSIPASGPPWNEVAGVSSGAGPSSGRDGTGQGRKGVLMARFEMGNGKPGFFFSLPPIWSTLFEPQADFAVRENIVGFIRAAAALAGREAGKVQAVRPRRVYHQVPFGMEFRLPFPAQAGEAPDGGAALLSIAGPAFSREYPLAGPGQPGAPADAGAGTGEARLEGLSLPAGGYRLELRRGNGTLWRDSLQVEPREALELARIGYDWSSLADLAGRSGGRVLTASPSDPAAPGRVASLLPTLPAAQVRMERMRIFPLYNTRMLFLAVFALLASAWLLRKKWDFD